MKFFRKIENYFSSAEKPALTHKKPPTPTSSEEATVLASILWKIGIIFGLIFGIISLYINSYILVIVFHILCLYGWSVFIFALSPMIKKDDLRGYIHVYVIVLNTGYCISYLGIISLYMGAKLIKDF